MQQKRYTAEDNVKITNSLLQFLPVTLISFLLTLYSMNEYVWGFAYYALCGSLTCTILLQASFESDKINYGQATPVLNLYNSLAESSTYSLLISIIIYAVTSEQLLSFKLTALIASLFVIIHYLKLFYSRL